MKLATMILAMLLLAGFATASDAAQVRVTGNVVRTLVTDQDRWGGCMAQLSVSLSEGSTARAGG